MDTWVHGRTVCERAPLPINVWVNPFEPGHSQNHLISSEGSYEEGFLMFYTTEGEREDYGTIRVD